MDIIPAIDLIEGKCVRLAQGDYDRKTTYNENPLEVAKAFEDHGVRRLHIVDLDGAKAQHIVNHRVLENIATHTSLVIDFGGGLKTDDDLRIAFECGAKMITGGSIAVKSPEIFESWIHQFGAEKIILGADVKNEKIAVTGWTEDTGLSLLPFLKDYAGKGIRKVICTDISKDGMLQGPSTELYKKILTAFPDMYLVASGGVSSVTDLEVLAKAGLPAVIFGKALYEGKIALKDLRPFL
ncbi:MAG: 1-(5-phosphoribosyl)-5-[(5-phosphoribosylamino)methylideneamino]imidazole-4-carboxamide isomerase [Bacteroidales bacterium]|nr:1-(5-phosphoribosyl)-5-[(5-phosphoribosylamino)methylideneamino]imidazole-4-carboxamide isomerase [Bacteroidales bacterium]MDD3907826.1 1-(5-phosphoribosyl)-5-[(5-phosphoribosylamino)methylideneamino]imidazole-4-carboxamide isomerase [Bacteroidales bacterium]MDD4712643.1 1-(5-phosphoribosyl)-5-[(5-phosphoribosylamino)methylideneamino]imidazole-4-carboxamide isomerase [Bacteroidales bacterium]